MSYIVVYAEGKRGSVAVESSKVESISKYLIDKEKRYFNKGIEFALIGNLNVYREYSPFHVVESEEEFKKEIKKMSVESRDGNIE